MNNAQSFLAFLVLVAASSGLGCADECQLGEGKCEGNTAWLCYGEGDNSSGRKVWREFQDCGAHVCKASSQGAVCSLTDARDPICEFTANEWLPGAGVCQGSVPVQCALGYRVDVGEDCQSPALCQPSGVPFRCAAVNGFHSVCQQLDEPSLLVRTSCYNNSVIFCREGRLLSYTDCANTRCGVGTPPPPGAEWCSPDGKCVPYASEPVAACQP